MATYYVDDGGGKAVTAATKANPCQVTITGHGFTNGDKVVFHNVGGMTQLNFTNGSTGYTVTVVDTDNITIGVDSTAYGTYTSGGTAHNGKSWGAAYTSVSQLDDIYSLNGDTIYIGHDHVCQYAHTSNRTLTLTGCVLISATTGSNPPTYQASTTNQIDTSEGAYNCSPMGLIAAYGIKIKAGGNTSVDIAKAIDCTFAPAANGKVSSGYLSQDKNDFTNCTIDLSADGTTNRSGVVFDAETGGDITNLQFVNPAYRTGYIFITTFNNCPGLLRVADTDFSGFTNATACELLALTSVYASVHFTNCKTAATWSATTGSILGKQNTDVFFMNVGNGNAPASLIHHQYSGSAISTTDIYRSSGATVEGTSNSWLVTTTANCSQDRAYYSPWIYGYISSTGSKTFDVYITNDTADFNDNEVWLEVDYLGTASSGQWSNKTDYMADRLATAAVQTDDTTSTWNGSGPSYTYKQKLSVTATVNTAGMFRARVCVGVASITSTRKFYIDPLVTVS